MTILVSHQAVPHILQQNCAHAFTYFHIPTVFLCSSVLECTKKKEQFSPNLSEMWRSTKTNKGSFGTQRT